MLAVFFGTVWWMFFVVFCIQLLFSSFYLHFSSIVDVNKVFCAALFQLNGRTKLKSDNRSLNMIKVTLSSIAQIFCAIVCLHSKYRMQTCMLLIFLNKFSWKKQDFSWSAVRRLTQPVQMGKPLPNFINYHQGALEQGA